MSYRNLIESGVASAMTYQELNAKSQKWVELAYEYVDIRNEVKIAEAA